MDNSKVNIFETIHEKYKEMRTLKGVNIENSSRDVLMFSLRFLLNCIEQTLKNLDEKDVQYPRMLAMKCFILYDQSKIIGSNDAVAASKILSSAYEIAKPWLSTPEVTYVGLRTIYKYSYYLWKMREFIKAKDILHHAEATYKFAKDKEDKMLMYYGPEELFSANTNISARQDVGGKVERLVTHCYQLLGLLYETLGDLEKCASYQLAVLRRDLLQKDVSLVEWAHRARSIGCYLFLQRRFRPARHLLAAAAHMLQRFEDLLTSSPHTHLSHLQQLHDFHRRRADLASAWVKYALYLYNSSIFPDDKHYGLEPVTEEDECDEEAEKSKEFPSTRQEDCSSHSEDRSLQINREVRQHGVNWYISGIDVSTIECEVTCELITTMEESRRLFLFANGWVRVCKSFYTLIDYPLDHKDIILDLSELLLYYSMYEDDLNIQYNSYRTRQMELEKLSSELKTRHQDVYLSVGSELLYELAEIQSDMSNMNLHRARLIAVSRGSGDGNTSSQETVPGFEVRHRQRRTDHTVTTVGSPTDNGLKVQLSRDETFTSGSSVECLHGHRFSPVANTRAMTRLPLQVTRPETVGSQGSTADGQERAELLKKQQDEINAICNNQKEHNPICDLAWVDLENNFNDITANLLDNLLKETENVGFDSCPRISQKDDSEGKCDAVEEFSESTEDAIEEVLKIPDSALNSLLRRSSTS